MSRDLTPRECWILHNSRKEDNLFLANIRFTKDGKHWEDLFTEKEIEDRKAHKYLAILGSNIYKELKSTLSGEQFEKLNSDLGRLANADLEGKPISDFPKEMVDWYCNKYRHWYSEPNDMDFMKFVLQNYGEK